jgi:hypothetical protein
MKKRILVAVVVLATLVLATMGASATDENLVKNGSFEYPDVPQSPYGWNSFPDGYGGLEWRVEWYDYSSTPGCPYPPSGRPTTANLEIHDSTGIGWGPAADGNQWVELDTDWYGPTSGPNGSPGNCTIEPSPVKIYQDIPTCRGGEYQLSFAFSARADGSPENRLGVYWDEGLVDDISKSGAFGWTSYSYTVIASSTSDTTRLEFVDLAFPDSYGTLLDNVSVVEISCVIEVDIDIKPGSYPNCFNMNGNGVVPVAILGSADFDVTQIDVSTLKFGGLDVRVKGNGTPQCSVEDVSGDFTYPEGAPDGFDDLVCQFVDDPATWSPDDGTATLSGNLKADYGSTPFEGSDEICLRPE